MSKVKEERILKAGREKQHTYKGTPYRLYLDFSAEPVQDRREWHDIFQVLKEEKLTTKNTLQQSCHSRS